MTTKITGGKITGLLALTCEAQYAGEIGDSVHVTGPYEVGLADATKPVLGIISVANKIRVGDTFPAAQTPGVVTVEARGLFVGTGTAGAAIAVGLLVKPDVANPGKKYVAAAVGDIGVVGLALTATTAANQSLDILFR